ncbi:MAG TPA: hypothetical protein VGK54_13425 [Chloroflexota bacterium]
MAGLIHVGVREVRKGLADYLDAASPVAIIRRGQTVGYYVQPEERSMSKSWPR